MMTRLRRMLGHADPRADARPEVPADMIPDFPEGLGMFYGIGAQKAGTSWLHQYLSGIPEIHFSRNKELHYFDVRAGRAGMALRVRVGAVRTLVDRLDTANVRLSAAAVTQLCEAAELLNIYTGRTGPEAGRDRHDPYIAYLTEGRTDQRMAGDITPSYSILDRGHFADMASIGEARFIFILRDPVARMWSHIRMSAEGDVAPGAEDAAVLEACRARIDTLTAAGKLAGIERADYLRTMTELEAAVPRSRILYVFFEDLFTGRATQDICAFLGVPHRPPQEVSRVNKGRDLPIPPDIETLFRDTFDVQYRGIRARFGADVPTGWRD